MPRKAILAGLAGHVNVFFLHFSESFCLQVSNITAFIAIDNFLRTCYNEFTEI